jgi:hypothetical protein
MRCFAQTLMVTGVVMSGVAVAQRAGAFGESRDHPAIDYTRRADSTAVSALNARLAAGDVTLGFEPGRGYLKSVLDALEIPVESQVLVYSETSFQARLISASNPRAVYFNDRAAVGWVRGGEVLEVAAQDPEQGTIFYTLPQKETPSPRLARNDSCLSCHLSWETLAVPGPFVLTVFPRASTAEYANGFHVDHRTPFEDRWGGWYVTGQRVPRSFGNTRLLQPTMANGHPERVTATASLEGRFDRAGYLTPYSDVAALMVLEHQTRAINLLTRTGWEARVAARLTPSHPAAGGSLPPRADEAANELVDYLLFVDEPPLPAPVAGSSGFAEAFARRGPRDRQGRSLRELDLSRRLMRYPLSYMVYSPQFQALPVEARTAVRVRLDRVLSGSDTRPKYGHLTAADRRAIRDILSETLPR